MKLQELLEKYKNKIYYLDFANIELSYYEKDVDLLCCRYGEFYPDIKPLSWLLFSTPFLSLLEWNELPISANAILDNYVIYDYNIPKFESDYHKINLVLLNTDAERKAYIEKFTL